MSPLSALLTQRCVIEVTLLHAAQITNAALCILPTTGLAFDQGGYMGN
jgi:hypothetical protein